MLKKILLMTLMLTLVACATNDAPRQDIEDIVVETAEGVQDSPAVTVVQPSSSIELNGDSDSLRAGNLQTVYFNYDSSDLTSSVIESLEANAQFLKDNPAVEVQIEGHCDDRGGIQYNLALGEKRAKSVKQYLEALGVESGRISTISYGKERPKAFGSEESSWSQNRRANFVIMSK